MDPVFGLPRVFLTGLTEVERDKQKAQDNGGEVTVKDSAAAPVPK